MRDPRLDRLADVIVGYSAGVRKGDLVALRGDPATMPGIAALFERVLKAGGHPFYVAESEELDDLFYAHASDEQLSYLSPLMLQRVQTIDVAIAFWGEMNTRRLARVDPAKQAIHAAARKPYFNAFLKRAAAGELRWCGTQYPTLACAQDAEMSLAQYEDFVFRAGLLHLPDPVAAWKKMGERQQRVCDWLNTKKSVRFTAPPSAGRIEGTDLTVHVEGSTWINCQGKENFPDGEVFAGPKGVDGVVNYTFPAVYHGADCEGVRLKFKAGRVVEASATRNEDYLIKMLDMDAGARGLGEIAIGTNYGITQFTRNTLFDEKIGGTFHAAVGAGYPESGSDNESGLHWDMVCDLRPGKAWGGGQIEADGEVFHRDGSFVNPAWPGPGRD